MAERATPELRIEQLGTADETWQAFVARRMDGWLRAERDSTVAGHNRVLNNYADRREAYTNLNKSKAGGHFMRYRSLMSLMGEGFYDAPPPSDAPPSPEDDILVSKVVHFSEMFVAGGILGEHNLRAESPYRYKKLRYGFTRIGSYVVTRSASYVHSAVTDEAVAKGVWLGVDEGAAQARKALRSDDMYAHMQEYSLNTNKAIKKQYMVKIPKLLGSDFPAGVAVPPEHGAIDALHTVQRLGIGLTVAHMAIAAEVRGSADAVSSFWPDSISMALDRDLVYPLAAVEPDYTLPGRK